MKHSISLLAAALAIALASCKKPCEVVCQNGGAVVEDNCSCNCPPGYSGDFCQTQIGPTCSLTNAGTIWESPDGLQYQNEAQYILPEGYFMTGIGFSCTSTNMNTIMVKGRKLNVDCSIGSNVEFRAGDLPDASLEKQFTVPSGYAITGVGVGVSGTTVTGLRVFYRQLVQQADGSWRLGSQLTYDNGGAIQRLSAASQLGSTYSSQYVLTGFGAIVQASSAYQTWARVGKLNP
ncbi:MAG: hypothetical protein WBO28_09895 [Flavobacteriales bacterium]